MSAETELRDRRNAGLYWDKAWKLVEGCTKCSPGCDNCWSERESLMRAHHPNKKISGPAASGDFNGNIFIRDDNLHHPIYRKRPTVFSIWNDLFHPDVPTRFIAKAYAMMAHPECEKHTFLILTKRPERMANFVLSQMYDPDCRCEDVYEEMDELGHPDATPCGNVWHGVTVCNQPEANQNLPLLLLVPGQRFLSIEPMLGPIEFSNVTHRSDCVEQLGKMALSGIHQVLLGGESGAGARPMHPDWARSVMRQCQYANVPFYFKQWGEWVSEFHPEYSSNAPQNDCFLTINDAGDDYSGVYMGRVGKKKAGREIDGKRYDELVWDGDMR